MLYVAMHNKAKEPDNDEPDRLAGDTAAKSGEVQQKRATEKNSIVARFLQVKPEQQEEELQMAVRQVAAQHDPNHLDYLDYTP